MIADITAAGNVICRSMSSASRIVIVSWSLIISRIGTPRTLSQFLELATKDVIHLQLLGDFPGNIHTMGADFSPGGILGKADP